MALLPAHFSTVVVATLRMPAREFPFVMPCQICLHNSPVLACEALVCDGLRIAAGPVNPVRMTALDLCKPPAPIQLSAWPGSTSLKPTWLMRLMAAEGILRGF